MHAAKVASREAGMHQDLKSLIGVLWHACKVVKPGRTFLRRLIDLSRITKKPSHFVRLNRAARSDTEWWFRFTDQWNGVSIMYSASRQKSNFFEMHYF